MANKQKTIAFAGNPNAGKTSLFNALTGSVQQVSNYPGVTVERKEGVLKTAAGTMKVYDLPGTYSLSAYSPEETIARDVIIHDTPDVVVNVIDAANLERNLYLTVQLMEMRPPMVIALNMIDLAEKNGLRIDTVLMSRLLGVPVVATVANKNRGLKELTAACQHVAGQPQEAMPAMITYGHPVDEVIADLKDALAAILPADIDIILPLHWLAVRLIEGDVQARQWMARQAGDKARQIELAVGRAIHRIETHFNDDVPAIIAERRFGFAAGIVRNCVSLQGQARQQITDQIDAVVCHKLSGPLILVAVVAALFFAVFKISDEWRWIPWPGGMVSPNQMVESLFAGLSRLIEPIAASAPLVHSLLNNAIIGGVGGVIGFVPLIFIMFFFIGMLEDCGYIARVAFIMDRVLRVFGLQGKSILPMIVSGGLGAGGCAVPAVMATRILRDEKDRLITMLVAPFMNCGAKLPVYAMLIAAFFASHRTGVMLLLWALSWIIALTGALLLRKFIFRGELTPFVMELPSYHVPTLKGILRHTIERTWLYLKKAGTIILAVNIIVWAMMSFPQPSAQKLADQQQHMTAQQVNEYKLSYSVAGRLGTLLEPLSKAAGFDWKTNIALISGFAAKELVFGSLATVYSIADDNQQAQTLSQRLAGQADWNPVRAFALMVFVMIYAPCLATVAAIRRESNSWKWAGFSVLWSTGLAFILAVAIYQIGSLCLN